ncbi:hypothetical protein KUTeg_022907 [Tegillarca granosa]|uniref:Uncharacterized protein n=1 Tax=Tegillarca granosa TaxID=220873 RepID=A0ABQ9E4Q4_TEGGR|nr:hypothetical protein KUTeg_022907 [Tegillarca granosa]
MEQDIKRYGERISEVEKGAQFLSNRYESQQKINDESKKLKLEILDADTAVEIDRAHRIGRKNSGKAKADCFEIPFVFNKDENQVKKKEKLTGTGINFADQYPKEISERRKSLIPILQEEKRKGNRVKLVRDKLYQWHRI